MDSHSKSKGLILQAFSEAAAYKELTDLESLVEKVDSLANVPIQPLFVAFQRAPVELIALTLPKLSPEQRQAISDLTLWSKDRMDVANYETLPQAYARCQDEKVLSEYVKSHDFLFYLKGRFGIHTFDTEDPVYPDHDNYFLTDDCQLLIEFDESFRNVDDIKFLLKRLYYELGVENAYAMLFKYVANSFSSLEEESYLRKRERLREYGFVDYYEALQFLGTFNSSKQIENFLSKKKISSPSMTEAQLSQALHYKTLIGFKKIKNLEQELSRVKDTKRFDYLRFHFLRFINGTLTLNGALSLGNTAISDSNKESERYVVLGYEYLMTLKGESEESLFETFDFFDCYKIGKSLVFIEKKTLKQALTQSIFEDEKYFSFLGDELSQFIDNSFEEKIELNTILDFESWKRGLNRAISILPYAQKLYENFQELKLSGTIQDSFYYNYNVDEIDFESLLLSSFANFYLGNYKQGITTQKLGVTIEEVKSFSQILKVVDSKFSIAIENFIIEFALGDIEYIERYLLKVCKYHLDGYDYTAMEDTDFKHIGGPIILTPTQ